ncbi:MAG: hypothetical protein AB1765_03790 [Candidatus Hydrogenedentota bacterium]
MKKIGAIFYKSCHERGFHSTLLGYWVIAFLRSTLQLKIKN